MNETFHAALLLTLALGTGCGPAEPEPIRCEPRELPTTEVSAELFVGTWQGCPGDAIDWHGEEIPEQIYCTFAADGELTYIREYEDGRVTRSGGYHWRVDGDVLLISSDRSSSRPAQWDVTRVRQDSGTITFSVGLTVTWKAVSCSGPKW